MSKHSQSDPFPIEFLFSHLRRPHIMIRARTIAVYSYFSVEKCPSVGVTVTVGHNDIHHIKCRDTSRSKCRFYLH